MASSVKNPLPIACRQHFTIGDSSRTTDDGSETSEKQFTFERNQLQPKMQEDNDDDDLEREGDDNATLDKFKLPSLAIAQSLVSNDDDYQTISNSQSDSRILHHQRFLSEQTKQLARTFSLSSSDSNPSPSSSLPFSLYPFDCFQTYPHRTVYYHHQHQKHLNSLIENKNIHDYSIDDLQSKLPRNQNRNLSHPISSNTNGTNLWPSSSSSSTSTSSHLRSSSQPPPPSSSASPSSSSRSSEIALSDKSISKTNKK